MVSYHRMVLTTLMSREDLQDILEEVGVEDWRKIISNPVIKLFDSMNANETTMTTATMTIQEFYQ
jgi:arsenate reductase-like glutaredoxin family protein